MPNAMAVQVTIYLNEADQWHRHPLHLEILNYLRKENVYGATTIRTPSRDSSAGIAWKQLVWSKPAASCP